MTQQIERSLETEKQSTFQRRIDSITSRQLSPENIDRYANDALNDAVELVQDAVEASGVTGAVTAEVERAALTHVGLDPYTVETTLDHIAAVVDSIDSLDAELEALTKQSGVVITPPQSRSIDITPGDGSFGEKASIPRFKTVAFLLQNSFGVDLSDESQCIIEDGMLSHSMMRGQSYKMIELPGLNRTILVCDEEGNVTFVLDTEKMRKNNITSEVLKGLGKEDLNEYLSQHHAAGMRLVYSDTFVENIAALLDAIPEHGEAIEIDAEISRVLRKSEKAPEGFLAAKGICDLLRVHPKTLALAVEELREELGEIGQYTFSNRVRSGFTPEQQMQIRRHLEAKGLLAEDAPEGVLSLKTFAQKLRIADITLSKVIDELGDELGDIEFYKFGVKRRSAKGVTAVQQGIIEERLTAEGRLGEAPEGALSISGVAERFGVDWSTVRGIIDELGDELGAVGRYKVYNTIRDCYSPEQQDMIGAFLSERVIRSVPDGFVTGAALAANLGISQPAVYRAIKILGDVLGDPGFRRKAGSNYFDYYGPEQQQMIRDYLEARGNFAEAAPDDVVASSRFARNNRLNYTEVKRAIEALDDELGERKTYQFGSFITEGLTPHQQAILREHFNLDERVIVEAAPDGVLSRTGLAKAIGVDVDAIDRAVNSLEGRLGEVEQYRFRQVVTVGYDRVQQERILEWLKENGRPDLRARLAGVALGALQK